MRNGEPYPHKKHFWRYEIPRDLTSEEIHFIEAYTGISCYRYFKEHEFVVGHGERPEGADINSPVANIYLRVTKRVNDKYEIQQGIQFSLEGLEMLNELGDLDVSLYDDARQRIQDVIAIMNGREIIE